ncbi:MAG: YfbM family protein [Candidatus Obscuribacterales bacterium]
MSMIYYMRLANQEELDKLLRDPEIIEDWLDDEDYQEEELEMGKLWHGVHFLLTGSPWEGEEPACYLLHGGETIGDIDVGYGPARAINPQQVKAFHEFLKKINRKEIEKRFDQDAFAKNEIYPSIWKNGSDRESIDDLDSSIQELRDFLEVGAKTSCGAVMWLC